MTDYSRLQTTPTRTTYSSTERTKGAPHGSHPTPTSRVPIYVQRSPRTPANKPGAGWKKCSVLCTSPSETDRTASNSTSNPFDVDPDQLTMPSCSPSVFSSFFSSKNKPGSSSKKSFRWSIEQLSTFWPVDIDEESIQYVCSRDDNEEYEVQSQQAIEKYFSQKDIVPSPWVVSNKNAVPLSSSPISTSCKTATRPLRDRKSRKRSVWSQTVLTIPPSVDVEAILGQYFKFDCDQQQSEPPSDRSMSFRDTSSGSLRRRLFCNGINEHSPAPDEKATTFASSHAEECGKNCSPQSLNLCSSPIGPVQASFQAGTPDSEPMQLSPICRTDRRTALGDSAKKRSVPIRIPSKCVHDTPEKSAPATPPDEEPSEMTSAGLQDTDMSTREKDPKTSDPFDSTSSSSSDIDSQCGRISLTGPRLSDMDTGYQTYNSNGKLDSINLRLPSVGCSRTGESGGWGSLVISQQTDSV
ncbi:protein aurora borealis-like isoform X2 [Ornithodoros turicata]|uniref:protein aurora borealis-like isoform X2 n=1 Tax=Ornithodoros turicata TaxID=34597 RepID=UPI003139AC40